MEANSLLSATKQAVDAFIIDRIHDRAKQAAVMHPRYGYLWQEIARIYQAGGKRMRPYLTVIAYGQLNPAIVPVAAAQELLHVAMLVHDDIIDQDTIRHGEKTINGAYEADYTRLLSQQQSAHYANSAAMLAGDALLSEAHHVLQTTSFSPSVSAQLSEQLSQSTFEAIGGELIDVEAGFITTEHFDPMTIYRYKTASYSMVGPLVSGALCADLDEATQHILHKFGTQCGIAFQLQDDLIGVFGNETTTGKPADTDLREGKQTVLIASHQVMMNDEQKTRFAQWFGVHDAPDEALHQLKQDIDASGAHEKTEIITQRYFAQALATLAELPRGFRRDELEQFVNRLQERSY